MRAVLNAVGVLASVMLVAGCEGKQTDTRPLLTQEAFLAAAQKCGALESEFTFELDGKLPSFSYVDPGPFNTGKATPTSQCLADSLKGYRFESMTIRTRPEPLAGE